MIAPAVPGPAPWTPADLRRLGTTTTLGVVGLIICWYQVSGSGRLSAQMGWLDAAVAAVVVVCAGNVGWFLAGRRAIGQRRQALLARMGAEEARPHPVVVAGGHAEGALVAVEGLTRYHLPGCPLTQGRVTKAASLDAHEAAGRRACGICMP